MTYAFDEDTAVERRGDGAYSAVVTGRWNVGGGPNGGYLAAIQLRAVLAESPLPDPLTMTIHYLSRPSIGKCDVSITTLRVGRGHTTFHAELGQAGEVRCAALVTVGRLREPGPDDFQREAPVVPEPTEAIAVRRTAENPALWEQLETRAARADDLFFLRTEAGEAVTGGWTRFSDGRETDTLAMAVFVDCWPPAVFSRTMRADGSGAPTIELTVHWRNRTSSDWCYSRFETRTLAGGYFDEHCELWDEAGVLVAESRQLPRYLG